MTTHRASKPAGPTWFARLRDRVGPLVDPAYPVAHADSGMIARSAPFTLSPQHPWRSTPCLVCWQTPGDRPVILLSIIDPRTRPAAYWRIGAHCYLMCERHDQAVDEALMATAHKREAPGCPCHSVSPAVRASFPYHVQGSETMC